MFFIGVDVITETLIEDPLEVVVLRLFSLTLSTVSSALFSVTGALTMILLLTFSELLDKFSIDALGVKSSLAYLDFSNSTS